MAGVEFTPQDARVIAHLLVETGIDAIEAGIIAAGDVADQALLSAVLDTAGPDRTMTVVLARSPRQTRADLDRVIELGCRSVMLSIPASPVHAQLKLGSEDPKRVLSLASRVIAEAKDRDLTVTFSAEDGARTDPGFLEEYVGSGASAGADRFRLAETVSVLRPAQCAELVRRLVHASDGMEVEMHSHNMLGLAVANALAAAEAGASWISTTVGGLGERGGNTPVAEILCSLHLFWGDRRYRLDRLTALTRAVEERSGVASSLTAGPTGELSYAYEIAGQLSHPDAFEAIPAEAVGNQRRVRVRSRLKPALVRALLPSEVVADADVDGLVEEMTAELPSGKQTWSESDLVERFTAHCAASAVQAHAPLKGET
jgi:homocitrate synthase NifV